MLEFDGDDCSTTTADVSELQLQIEAVEGTRLPPSAFGPDAPPLQPAWSLWAAWAYTAVASQAVVWPLAFALTHAPGARGVLV